MSLSPGITWFLRKFASPFADQKRLLSPAPVETIFDVGGNIGQTVAKYKCRFPDALIYSFEPYPAACEQLSARYKGASKVQITQCALTNQIGHINFCVNEFSGHNSIFTAVESARRMIRQVQEMEVPTTTVDRFCQEHHIDRIDVLKMDIQGSELLCLQGAVEMLKRQAIRMIFSEVLFVSMYENQAFFEQVYHFLTGFGYSLYDIYNRRYVTTGQLKWADALFLSPQIQQTIPPCF